MRQMTALLLVAVAGCAHSEPKPDVAAVVISRFAGDVTYSAPGTKCKVSLILYEPPSVNVEGATLRNDCDLTVPENRQAFEKVLDRAFEDRKMRPLMQWIFMGGLKESAKLALLGLKSKDWDPVKGAATPGRTASRLFTARLQPQEFYPSQVAILSSRGMCVETSGIEKVMIAKVGDLPFKDELIQEGAKPTDLVPVGMQVWLRVRAC